MGKKRNAYRDPTASSEKHDAFGMIYASMLQSEVFQSLSIGARYFYVLCRVQAESGQGKQCLYQHGNEYGREYKKQDFVFPASHLAKYGFQRNNSTKYFSELKNAGFIDVKENNKPRKKVNVYSFSERWKDISPCISQMTEGHPPDDENK